MTARVRLVVPVVPEAAMTCAPLVYDGHGSPASTGHWQPELDSDLNGVPVRPQVGTHNDDAVNLAEFNLLGNLPVQPFSRLIDLLKSALGNDDRLP